MKWILIFGTNGHLIKLQQKLFASFPVCFTADAGAVVQPTRAGSTHEYDLLTDLGFCKLYLFTKLFFKSRIYWNRIFIIILTYVIFNTSLKNIIPGTLQFPKPNWYQGTPAKVTLLMIYEYREAPLIR